MIAGTESLNDLHPKVLKSIALGPELWSYGFFLKGSGFGFLGWLSEGSEKPCLTSACFLSVREATGDKGHRHLGPRQRPTIVPLWACGGRLSAGFFFPPPCLPATFGTNFPGQRCGVAKTKTLGHRTAWPCPGQGQTTFWFRIAAWPGLPLPALYAVVTHSYAFQ